MTSYFKIHSVKKKTSLALGSEVLDYQIEFLTAEIDHITDFQTLADIVDSAFAELFAFLVHDLPDSGFFLNFNFNFNFPVILDWIRVGAETTCPSASSVRPGLFQ